MRINDFLSICRLKGITDCIPYLQARVIDKSLSHKLVVILLSQGFNHSSKNTGLFNDQYLRDGFIADHDHSLLLQAINVCNQKIGALKSQIIVPVIALQQAQRFCNELPKLHQHVSSCEVCQVIFDSITIDCLKVTLSKLAIDVSISLEIIRMLGTRGALASKDQLFNILAGHLLNTVTTRLPGNELYFSSRFPISMTNVATMLRSEYRANISTDLPALRQKIETRYAMLLESSNTAVNNRDPLILQGTVYEFYQCYIRKMLIGCQLDNPDYLQALSTIELALLASALRRIEQKNNFAVLQSESYSEFILAQELIIDEIIGLLTVACAYTEQDFISAASNALIKSFNLSITDKPVNLALTGSCMHAMNLHVQAAVNYCMRAKGDVKVYIAANTYHEIPESWELVADHKNNRIITISAPQNIAQQYDVRQKSDVLILATNTNINYEQSGFGSSDVHSIIDEQLQLRSEDDDSSQLIVILDLTMNCLDDVQLQLLFNVYLDKIKNGSIAFLVAYSLNKYFQVGCDKSAAGLGAAFYAANKFIGLNPAHGLLGYHPQDSTPQLITHMLKHATDSISSFYSILHGLSRHIHATIIPENLYINKSAVYIDRPYTNDLYKNPWSFLVIRFADKQLSDKYESEITNYLQKIGIGFRDGFGFNQSTYIVIEKAVPTIIRISIGPDATEQKFQQVVTKLMAINLEIECSAKSTKFAQQLML